jgi:uncharacterized repeat protein (TIGR03837 family)
MRAVRSWDVFCRVVDNFGDAAVCWRLACGLAALPSRPRVRLWIDEPQVLHALVPPIDPNVAQQTHAGVEVWRLVEEPYFGAPADVAVDGFGGGLPEVYAHAMVERVPRSLWIVLEYLSAEAWVASHHRLPSPHPHLPLQRYFFFPGVAPGTGGLLREAGLTARRQAFVADPQQSGAFWHDAGFAAPPGDAAVVSLFGYENAPLAKLVEGWAAGSEAVVAGAPPSRLAAELASLVGARGAPGDAHRFGSLEVRFMPFLAQDRYDQLLWLSDWNFVRGEDSFVRAQWAERPFLWHIYPQAEGAHLAKLEAFLDLYCTGLEPAMAGALRSLFRAWNRAPSYSPGDVVGAWRALSSGREELRRHARSWAGYAAQAGDLAMNLATFCTKRLQ